jgi:hypothetical protein
MMPATYDFALLFLSYPENRQPITDNPFNIGSARPYSRGHRKVPRLAVSDRHYTKGWGGVKCGRLRSWRQFGLAFIVLVLLLVLVIVFSSGVRGESNEHEHEQGHEHEKGQPHWPFLRGGWLRLKTQALPARIPAGDAIPGLPILAIPWPISWR